MERPRFPIAVHLFFLCQEQILLLRRHNTGYQDGKFSVVAGHLNGGETVTQAAIREAMEEVGVALRPEDLQVVGTMHRKSDDERVDFFIAVHGWSGELANCEPDKCSELIWFPMTTLPPDTIPYVRKAIENYLMGVWYDEFGW